jgi:hypothetical protein
MTNPFTILKAWGIAMNPDPEQNRIAEARLKICSTCEYKKINPLAVHYCSLCGCPIKGKIFTPDRVTLDEASGRVINPCDDNRWEE